MAKFVSRGKLAQPKGQPTTSPEPSSDHPQVVSPKITLELSKLPSKGVAYPPETVIRYRPYTFGEVKTLSQEHSPNKKNNHKHVFEAVLEGVFIEHMDKLDLTVADLLYLGLLRKISTVGGDEKITVVAQCSHCGAGNQFVFETGNMEFDELTLPKLPISITLKNKKEYKFEPLRVKQYFPLVEKKRQDEPLAILAAQCTNREYKECYEDFYSADVDDGALLQHVDQLMYHGMQNVVETCKSCKEDFTVSLDGGEGLILPFRRREESIESRVRFG